jgi:3-hydroxyacyl-[acyl-carrier-protein] dehydratase
MLSEAGTLVRGLRSRSQLPKEKWKPPAVSLVTGLIPHRAPFRFIDKIEHLDRQALLLVASYQVGKEEEPVFRGHFPGRPIFPGTLLIEAMGQAGACLISLCGEESAGVSLPLLVRVHHALFLAPVHPGEILAVEAGLIEGDDLRSIIAARVHRGSDICAIAILETHYVGS